MQISSNNLWLFKIYFWKGRKNKKKIEKIWKIWKRKKCENSKLDYPRFLGAYYFHGTINDQCTSKQESTVESRFKKDFGSDQNLS